MWKNSRNEEWKRFESPNLKHRENILFSIRREDLQSIAQTSSRMMLGRKMVKYIFIPLHKIYGIIQVSKNIDASGIINLVSFCFNSIRQRQRIDAREIYSLDLKIPSFLL